MSHREGGWCDRSCGCSCGRWQWQFGAVPCCFNVDFDNDGGSLSSVDFVQYSDKEEKGAGTSQCLVTIAIRVHGTCVSCGGGAPITRVKPRWMKETEVWGPTIGSFLCRYGYRIHPPTFLSWHTIGSQNNPRHGVLFLPYLSHPIYIFSRVLGFFNFFSHDTQASKIHRYICCEKKRK